MATASDLLSTDNFIAIPFSVYFIPAEKNEDHYIPASAARRILRRATDYSKNPSKRLLSPPACYRRCGPMRRREFLYNGLAGAGTLAFAKCSAPKAISSVDSRIEILIGKSLATISPDINGPFTEHLGDVIYNNI